VAGLVKTRLCPPLGPGEAALLAEGMLRDVVERCLACQDFRTALFHHPAEDRPWFAASFPAVSDLRPQQGSGLAERLANAFDEVLNGRDVETLVVIGSDQPLVGTARVVEAHRALEDGADLVLGPDLGGGYYLIGLRASCPALFTEVGMSSPGMCAATVELAEGLGLTVRRLEVGYDVDVKADLKRLRKDLDRWRTNGGADARDFPVHTAAVLQELYP
jgi:hypothetical protein